MSRQPLPGGFPAVPYPTADDADSKRHAVPSIIIAVLSTHASQTAASLLLLPLSRLKLRAHLPNRVLATSGFAGARETLAAGGAGLLTRAVRQPLGAVAMYAVGLVAGARVIGQQAQCAARLGVAAAVLRDGVYIGVEGYVLMRAVLAREEVRRVRDAEKMQKGGKMDGSEGKEGQGVMMKDAIYGAGVGGLVAAPLDFLRTRAVVGRGPLARTVRAVGRLGRSTGGRAFFGKGWGASSLYAAECMARPVLGVVFYTVLRAMAMSSWMEWRMEKDIKAGKQMYVVEEVNGRVKEGMQDVKKSKRNEGRTRIER